ncbi:MAG: hypothetical protein U0Y82_05070 [Thermoleophilia bacterium]
MTGIVVIPAEDLVPTWAARGIREFEHLLANHAAFQTWLESGERR